MEKYEEDTMPDTKPNWYKMEVRGGYIYTYFNDGTIERVKF
jgi:hypothetical protein